jgi:uncharacterized membrane protein YeaQ/YmgE (transglycosylase-associated protein family)
MTTANIIAWLLIGVIVGIVYALWRHHKFGSMTVLDMIIGVVGGLIGGVLLNAVGGIVGAEVIGVNLGAGLVAIGGALILVAIFEAVMRSPQE